jgi:hypothetical protein
LNERINTLHNNQNKLIDNLSIDPITNDPITNNPITNSITKYNNYQNEINELYDRLTSLNNSIESLIR